MLSHNKGRHGIAVIGDDAGNDEEQAPEEHIQIPQEILAEAGAEIVEFGEQVADLERFAIMLVQQVLGITQLNDSAQNKVEQIQSRDYRDG